MCVATVGCGTWWCGGGLLGRRIAPQSAADALSREEKLFSRGFRVHSECSRFIARLLSLSAGPRLKGPKCELGLGNGGSKTLGLLHEGG